MARTVTERPQPTPIPPRKAGSGGGGGGGRGAPDPWWHSLGKVVAVVAAFAFLGGAVGYLIASRGTSQPGAGSVDVGYLQDMRTHHDQAVQMATMYLAKDPDATNATERQIAREIQMGQQMETGVMAQMLRDWNQEEANETSTAMGWMQQPVPLDQMPGLATQANLDQLDSATGTAADKLFAQLMIDHHQGGIHMADYAVIHAKTKKVRDLAQSQITGQQSDIVELQGILDKLGS
jgi:uncharacterized protein (DUF305 family)